MTVDFGVTLLPAGPDTLNVQLRPPQLGGNERIFERPMLTLAPQDLSELRTGEANAVVVGRVVAALREWVGEEFTGALTAALNRWVEKDNLRRVAADALAGSPEDRDLQEKARQASEEAARLRIVLRVHETLLPGLIDAPFELLQLKDAIAPLVLSSGVSAFVHSPPKVSPAPAALAPQRWPLRVLLVRSNPRDLGGAVPEIGPICQEIQTAAGAPGRVLIDVLSGEPAFGEPATWRKFQERLEEAPYHIIVYLGHGDVRPGFEGVPSVGELLFETPDGAASDHVAADQLAVQLNKCPVPLVILAGCLTAAQLPEPLRGKLPGWMRGSQGVAQALVNGESGVQLAVGMRDRLATSSAQTFLVRFFRSLLRDTKGDIEAAVSAARFALHAESQYPPSWSAPVLFRGAGTEPTFAFIRTEAAELPGNVANEVEMRERLREPFWATLAQQSPSRRDPGFVAAVETALGRLEDEMRTLVGAHGAALMPERREAAPGDEVDVRLTLGAELRVRRLDGEVHLGGDAAEIDDVQAGAALAGADVDVWTRRISPQRVAFSIESRGAGGLRPLAPGALLLVRVRLAAGALVGCYPVDVTALQADPPHVLWAGSNVVIVPPP